MLHSEITEKIIKAFFKVYNTLGYGFLEKVYENALVIELQKMGFNISQQHNIKVYYDMKMVGDYYTDVIVDDSIIIELKAAETLKKEHKTQLINYLKATDKEVGLLLNFGRTPEFKRAIFTNDRKNSLQAEIDG